MVGSYINATMRYGICTFDMPIYCSEVVVYSREDINTYPLPSQFPYEIINPNYKMGECQIKNHKVVGNVAKIQVEEFSRNRKFQEKNTRYIAGSVSDEEMCRLL